MTKKGFVYIWEYIVKEDHLVEFKRIYGPKIGFRYKPELTLGSDPSQQAGKSSGLITEVCVPQNSGQPSRLPALGPSILQCCNPF